MTKKKTTEVESKETTTEVIDENVIGKVGQEGREAQVHQKTGFIKFETFHAPVSISEIKDDEIRQWLINEGYGTNVYKASKEWLEKHNVDPEMLAKLKKYLNDRYN